MNEGIILVKLVSCNSVISSLEFFDLLFQQFNQLSFSAFKTGSFVDVLVILSFLVTWNCWEFEQLVFLFLFGTFRSSGYSVCLFHALFIYVGMDIRTSFNYRKK